MQQSNDRYKQYAELLGEPMSDDLKIFVDALEAQYEVVRPPSRFGQFVPTPMTMPSREGDMFMGFDEQQRETTVDLAQISTLRASNRHYIYSRWPVAMIAVTLLAVIASLIAFSRSHAPLADSSVSRHASEIIKCLIINTAGQFVPPSVTSCDQAVSDTHIYIGAQVGIWVCLAPNIPLKGEGAIISDTTLPSNYPRTLAVSPRIMAQSLDDFVHPCQFVDGLTAATAGHYTVKIYWSPMRFDPNAPIDLTGKSLAQTKSFDVP